MFEYHLYRTLAKWWLIFLFCATLSSVCRASKQANSTFSHRQLFMFGILRSYLCLQSNSTWSECCPLTIKSSCECFQHDGSFDLGTKIGHPIRTHSNYFRHSMHRGMGTSLPARSKRKIAWMANVHWYTALAVEKRESNLFDKLNVRCNGSDRRIMPYAFIKISRIGRYTHSTSFANRISYHVQHN